MNSSSKHNARRSYWHKCHNAFAQYFPQSSLTKKEFIEILKSGNQFIVPDFYDEEILKKKSDVIFDGHEFKLINGDVEKVFTKNHLEILDAGLSSLDDSESSNAKKKRRWTSQIIFQCRNAYSKYTNEQMSISAFNELLLDEELRIPDEVSAGFNPNEFNIIFNPNGKKFELESKKEVENVIEDMIQKIVNENKKSIQGTSNICKSSITITRLQKPISPGLSETESEVSSSVSDLLKEFNKQEFAAEFNVDPNLCFQAKNTAIVYAEDITFEVKKVVGHRIGTDGKLYFDIKWKSCNGQEFEDTAESASLLHCDELIEAYLKKKRNRNLQLPSKRKCKNSDKPFDFEMFEISEQNAILDKYESLTHEKNSKKNYRKKAKHN